ncbi:MAG: four helix bundle protein [Saprospirales bacterium]|nr:MAG: four helix bundle protein [Saprospirales bacterium]
MKNMRDFRTWDVYKDSMNFVKDIYIFSKELPKDEEYGLRSQLRRAAVSIVNNIAEGSAKSSSKDFHRYLEISLGSAFEVETLLNVIKSLDYCNQATTDKMLTDIDSIERRLNAFIQKIRREDFR